MRGGYEAAAYWNQHYRQTAIRARLEGLTEILKLADAGERFEHPAREDRYDMWLDWLQQHPGVRAAEDKVRHYSHCGTGGYPSIFDVWGALTAGEAADRHEREILEVARAQVAEFNA